MGREDVFMCLTVRRDRGVHQWTDSWNHRGTDDIAYLYSLLDSV